MYKWFREIIYAKWQKKLAYTAQPVLLPKKKKILNKWFLIKQIWSNIDDMYIYHAILKYR